MPDSKKSGLLTAADGKQRCWWYGEQDDYLLYHDHEWGRPVTDEHRLFEKICLEGFQAGLSWLTILRKRENFRQAFAHFDFEQVAKFTDADVERLVQDAGIIRHRGKITSTINNAKHALKLRDEFGSLAAYFWRFEPNPSKRPKRFTYKEMTAFTTTDESKALSKDLKKRGWSFVGPTTMYAFMQAMGMVNDHLEGCHCRDEIEQFREQFTRPD